MQLLLVPEAAVAVQSHIVTSGGSVASLDHKLPLPHTAPSPRLPGLPPGVESSGLSLTGPPGTLYPPRQFHL